MLVLIFVLYAIIGVIINELSINIKEQDIESIEYSYKLRSDFVFYTTEMLMWLPDLVIYFLENKENE